MFIFIHNYILYTCVSYHVSTETARQSLFVSMENPRDVDISPWQEMFTQMDADGDGKVTRFLEQRFNREDLDLSRPL